VQALTEDLSRASAQIEERWREGRVRTDELSHVLQTIVEIGLRGGWVEFEGTPLKVPRIQMSPEVPELCAPSRDHPPDPPTVTPGDKTD